MQSNTLLSIVIPTCNRADFIDHCLQVHIPLAKAHNIQIFVSDNASTDATKEVVRKRMEEYPLISYHCNDTNVGPDENFERALKYPQTEYVWLLGDAYRIPPEGIAYVLELVSRNSGKYDAIVVNVANRVKGIPGQDYSDSDRLLADLGWHTTCLAGLIYNSRLIAQGAFARYRSTNFIQMGVLFDYIANRDFLVHWAETISVQVLRLEGTAKLSWENRVFEIWVKSWPDFVFSLPAAYSQETKLKCIKEHGGKSGLFSLGKLLYFRGAGFLNYKIYRQFSHLFHLTISYPKFIIFTIALLPRSPISLAYKGYKIIKKWNRAA